MRVVAWFTASMNTPKAQAATSTVTTVASATSISDLYFVPTVSADNTVLSLTDSEGETFAIVENGNNYVFQAAAKGAGSELYATVTVSFGVYSTITGDTDGDKVWDSGETWVGGTAATPAQLKSIAGTYNFTLSASGRGRIAVGSASDSYAAAVATSISGQVIIDGEGAITYKLPTTAAAANAIPSVYLSVSGDETTTDREAGEVVLKTATVKDNDSAPSTVVTLSW